MNDYERADAILKIVARECGIRLRRLRSTDRARELAAARDVAAYLIRQHTALSLVQIGALLGGRDHSTISCCIGREKARLACPVPRRDGRLQAEWHAHLINKAQSEGKSDVQRSDL